MSAYQFNIVAVDGEPRVLDLDVAEALAFARPHNIRDLIARNSLEIERYGILPRHAVKSGGRGRPSCEYRLNEAQALLIATFSRTERAADIRQALITAFLDWRAGKTVPVRAHNRRPPWRDDAPAPIGLRLQPDPARIEAAFDVRRGQLGSLPYDQVLDLLARGLARLDDIAPEPLTYSQWRRDAV